jgi:hypothetical protein
LEKSQTGGNKQDQLTNEISRDIGMLTQSFSEERQRQWRAFINRENTPSRELDNFSEVVERLNNFLSAIVDAARNNREFGRFEIRQ